MNRTFPRTRSITLCLSVFLLVSSRPAGFEAPAAAQGISDEEAVQLATMELPTEPAELLAIVGSTPILVGDLLPKVDNRIAAGLRVDISEVPEVELKIIRLKLLRNLLSETIENKMLGHAFVIDKVGSASADQRKEAEQKIESQARRAFGENEIPRLMEGLALDTVLELDAKLREKNMSLKVLEDDYKDRMLKTVFLQQLIPREPEVSLNEISRYYSSNQNEFRIEAAATWEQLSVLFEKTPSRDEARQLIEAMGREAYYGNMQSVARSKSQEPLAFKGGVHDWTQLGSLVSKVLEREIHSIPLNRLSNVIEDEWGFHIVRVLDRRDVAVKPLFDVQDQIRETISEQKMKVAEREVLARIRRDVPVWTRYPEDVEGSKSLNQLQLLR